MSNIVGHNYRIEAMVPARQYDWESLLPLRSRVLDACEAQADFHGQTVMITGAGGSIGAALALAVAQCGAQELLLLDASEHSLYSLDRELTRLAVAAPCRLITGRVDDRDLMRHLFRQHRPRIVFHAAAFKHVPLMEINPFAAIQNNALGSFVLAQAALDAGVRQLVMVSTDKAVDPASMMGASKRIAELILLSMPGPMRSKSVRLGNVLGSQGSVMPLFLSQIERGEAVTVSHPNATRYFLSLHRAVALLIHALDAEHQGILVPELGEPVLIAAFAQRLIDSVAGSAEPKSQIVYTGLRPGDKLSEQLLSPREAYIGAAGPPLRAVQSPALSFAEMESAIARLGKICREHDLPALLDELSRLVPGYSPSLVLQQAAAAGCLP